ncbi:pyridoxal phosphate-dependent transferase [Bombardia bombarda]|uniref:Pyridoxal phosphate-dependent transferase n=1 Tax=Bombardia bombarda TaxID=252184 RepID=A0AA39TIR5_9PEZI|nr:pyridoxal phosphate-dependent transferase [Bombardia bombarda]
MASDTPDAAAPATATGPNQLAAAFGRELSLASRSVHADDYINNHRAVAPPMHVSTTFRYSRDPEILKQWSNIDPNAPHDSHIYSRDSAPNTTRLESVLSSLLGGPTLTYSSGLAAFHAMLVFLNPKRIAIGGGYHGCHGVIELVSKLTGLRQLELESDADLAQLQPGDILHVETPLNPTGEARDLAYYRRRADELGCYLTYGVDVILHSGTKYFGGHSDLLSGTLTIRPDHAVTPQPDGKPNWVDGLRIERLFLGSVMGSLEGWLGVRSLRTLELRVVRQSESAQRLVDWLAAEINTPGSEVGGLVAKIQHASQQPEAQDAGSWLRKQMPNGYGPVFSLWLRSEDHARRLPSKLHLFHHATSLGGVESLIEWRAMSDLKVDKRLLRVSIGVEGWEDLRDDLLQGLRAL